jgi:hypothetical protein
MANRPLRFCCIFLKQQAITFISPGIEPAIGHGVFHGAVRFVTVRAIGEFALVDKRPQIAEEAGDLGGDDVPKLKLPNAGRVDHIAVARGQPNESRGRGGVLALLRFLADGGHTQFEARFNRVQGIIKGNN